MKIRVRYAPSPTGLQHVGGLRTALFNYLFAKKNNGIFYLRLEDTDRTRYNPEAEQDLYDSLGWAGLTWDEGPDIGGPFGPYVQSQRLAFYQEYAQRLLEEGRAYRCFCTPERLEQLRQEQEAQGLPTSYDRKCRNLSKDESEARARAGESYVIRLALPLDGSVTINDLLLGEMSFSFKDLPVDPVLLKSDGFPTYHLAHVVDDYLMQTSHVIRSQEWLSSLGLHVYLFQAFGINPPHYLHLPLVLGPDGQKLSKRHGATSVRQFWEQGFLPQALINGLALLGWSSEHSKDYYYTLNDLEKIFELESLNKSPAVLDYKKLEHFNTLHIKNMPDELLIKTICDYLRRFQNLDGCEQIKTQLLYLLPFLRERVVYLNQTLGWIKFLWEFPEDYSELVPKKSSPEQAKINLQTALGLLDQFKDHDEEVIERGFREWCEQNLIKLGDVLMPLRIALTGSKVSLPIFPIVKVLGWEGVLIRIKRAIEFLDNQGVS